MEIYYVLIALLVVCMILGLNGIHLVPEYLRIVIFRLGRPLNGFRGPGLVFTIPVIDHAVKVDMQEQTREVPDQVAVTKDSIPVNFSIRWKFKVVGPVEYLFATGNFEIAAVDVAVTALRKAIGEVDEKDLSAKRAYFDTLLLIRLDEVDGNWGIKVTNVEVVQLQGQSQ